MKMGTRIERATSTHRDSMVVRQGGLYLAKGDQGPMAKIMSKAQRFDVSE